MQIILCQRLLLLFAAFINVFLLYRSVTIRRVLFLWLLHRLILWTQWLYEFIKLLKQRYAESDFILQIITLSSRCFICSQSKTCQWRCNEVWETDRTHTVKWKICNKYHENAPLWAILGVKYIFGWSYSKWRTHPRRINGTSNVFFFVMHHYEAVNLSTRGICALWSPSRTLQLLQKHFWVFSLWVEVHMEKRLTKQNSDNRCFTALFWPHLHGLLAC